MMPANHHCDIERIMDLIKYMRQRLDKTEENLKNGNNETEGL
jgi:hypothetical protein